MSNIPISSLPIALSLTGSEAVPLVQAGTTKTATVSLINASNIANIPIGGLTGQGLVKQSNANYDTTWKTISGFGTVQEVDTGTGLTGGPITLTGTVSLAPIASHTLLANITGGSAAPIPNTPSSVLDIIGATQGDILYRDSGGWNALAPGSNGQILTSQGAAANPKWSAVGSGTVQSVGLSLPSIFTVSGSPVTTTGTLTAALANQNPNLVWAGPGPGAAAAPSFRSLIGTDLPNPSATTLGGIQSFAGTGSQWIRSISTSGIPASSQPAFSDISGSIASAQFGSQSQNAVLAGPTSGSGNPTFRALAGGDLPNPGASSLGGVQSFAQVANQFLTQISTSGVVSSAQPSFANLSGNASLAQLPLIGNNTILSNISGSSAGPLANSLSSVIDSSIASTQGDILYRNGTIWTALPPGTSGQVLSTGGTAANPSWTTVSGTGTVTNVATNNGLAGGPITSSGTIGLATIATGNVLAYTGAGSGVPVATVPSAVLDVIGSTQGNVLYRGASSWAALAPGTNGQFLQTSGAGSTPQWATSVTPTGSPSSHQVSVFSGGSSITGVGPGTNGQALVSNGASANPSFQSGGWVLLNTLTASAQVSLSDTTSFTSAYTEYELVFKNVVAATANVTGQLAVHSGGVFQTSGYLTSSFGIAAGPTAFFDGGTTFISMSHASSVTSGTPGINGRVQVSNPSVSGIHPWTGVVTYPISGASGTIVVGGYWNSAAVIDGFAFNFGSGNITSGTIEVYGRL